MVISAGVVLVVICPGVGMGVMIYLSVIKVIMSIYVIVSFRPVVSIVRITCIDCFIVIICIARFE